MPGWSQRPGWLAGMAPIIAADAVITYRDDHDTVRATHGYAKQGVGYCYTKIVSRRRGSEARVRPPTGTRDTRSPTRPDGADRPDDPGIEQSLGR